MTPAELKEHPSVVTNEDECLSCHTENMEWRPERFHLDGWLVKMSCLNCGWSREIVVTDRELKELEGVR